MVEGRSAGDGFLTSVCNSSERLLHEKKRLLHKMTRAVSLSRLWACTVPLPCWAPSPAGAVPSQGTLHPLTRIFSPPGCPDATSRAAGVLTRRDKDGCAC